jgi:Holliday junction resolvasome RuvABC endonuclease subunit
MIFVGIDYSLTCPCVCVSRNKVFADSYFHFLSDNKKAIGKVGNIYGDEHDEYLTDQQRYENIASWALNIISPLKEEELVILIEDYSFGSKGRVFNLAENCGILKYMLYKQDYKFFTVPPTVIKKYATGKGNADKQKMYESFFELTQIDLHSIYSPKSVKLASPVTDIVDAFYLTHYMQDSIINKDMEKINANGTVKTRRAKGKRANPKL